VQASGVVRYLASWGPARAVRSIARQ
jgi:hypothetical protein